MNLLSEVQKWFTTADTNTQVFVFFTSSLVIGAFVGCLIVAKMLGCNL